MARILLVEDDPDLAVLTREILEAAGHQVQAVADGNAALECVRSFCPELVVTDILMPNRGGLDLIREIRRRSPSLPIVAVSGGGRSGKLNFLKSAEQFPAVRTLRKPFAPDALLGLVSEALLSAGRPGQAPEATGKSADGTTPDLPGGPTPPARHRTR